MYASVIVFAAVQNVLSLSVLSDSYTYSKYYFMNALLFSIALAVAVHLFISAVRNRQLFFAALISSRDLVPYYASALGGQH